MKFYTTVTYATVTHHDAKVEINGTVDRDEESWTATSPEHPGFSATADSVTSALKVFRSELPKWLNRKVKELD